MTEKINITEASNITESEIARLKKALSDSELQREMWKGRYEASVGEVVKLKIQFKKGLNGLIKSIDRVKKPTSEIRDIQEKVCVYFSITFKQLVSKDRHSSLVKARQIAMYLCRQTEFSYPVIGREFNNRHHTTIIDAVKRIEKREDLKQIAGEISK